MSMGPLGMIAGAASSPLAQSQGTDVQRAQQESTHQAREAQAGEKAQQASGVGQTEQDEAAADRDADGRRPWEQPPGARPDASGAARSEPPPDQPVSVDPTGERGGQLDLLG
jgi:type II secretory pathway pseudopilin PulG